ncbi:HEAT repeat domain-containing protein, partial [candidate division NPL-UPA2 bacterium]|nr:HEAT repeat domain-containing protein [candidate division NPL-UPA2 bacterium]
PRVVEPLIASLRDEDPHVRRSAARALGKIGDPRAVGPLIAALKDEDSNVRKSAAESLKKITEKAFGKYPVKWQEWWEENKEAFLR